GAGRRAPRDQGHQAAGRVSGGPGSGARPHRLLRRPGVAERRDGRRGNGSGRVHVRERHRSRRRQPRPHRRVRNGGRAGPAVGSRRRAAAGRRRPHDPVAVRDRRAGAGGGKELPVVTERSGQRGFTVWFTGLSGAGKSTIAEMLFHELRARGLKTEILDGDVLRQNLSKGLGFSKEDRDTNIRRIGFVANLLTRNGVATICCPISPYRETRDEVRRLIGDFVEVYVHATVEELARSRDPKGLYKKALAGEIKGFTGVDDPYEPPENPELVLDTMTEEPVESLQAVLEKLHQLGYIEDPGLLVEGDRLHSGFTDLRVTDSGHVAER